MLTVLGSPRRFCDGLTRRDTLKAGALSLLGGYFGLPGIPEAVAARPSQDRPGRAKSVILLFLHGGAPTQDMYDLKQDAPLEVRGEFSPIATNVPGIQICEHLPRTARWMHKAAIVRTVNHRAGCHNTVPAFTGWDFPLTDVSNANPNHPPSMGSVCEYLRRDQGELPAYVCLPSYLGWGDVSRRPGIYAGFLGQRFDPFCSECDPSTDPGAPTRDRAHPPEVRGAPRIPNGVLAGEITLDRLSRRHSLLDQIDAQMRRVDAQAALGGFGRTRQRAFDLLTSAQLRNAFDLEREDPRLRERYGRSLFGNSVLTARKLVEAGVRFVNVFWDSYGQRFNLADYGWDTHEHNFITLRHHFLPCLDRTYTALLEDLDNRGLLDETLVVVMSDFGRTPRVNRDAGRDHWTYCYSVLLAGAGIRGGTIYGASDAHAAAVRDNPVSPADICATIYQCLGINPETPVQDRTGRPIPVAQGGRALREILL
jgi:uncharacterized protein (DUF1501 family)